MKTIRLDGVRVGALASLLLIQIQAPNLNAQSIPSELSGELSSDDELVLLGDSSSFPLLNFEDEDSPDGNCFGVVQTQYALWSLVHFEEGPRESNESIQQKLTKAASTSRPVTIQGFKNSKDFLNHYKNRNSSNPLFASISYLQQNHGILIQGDTFSQQKIKWTGSVPSNPRHIFFHPSIHGRHSIETLRNYLDQKIPLVLSVFPREGEAHAVTLVGYIRRRDEQLPHKFLVRDPNDPGVVKIIQVDINRQAFDIPQLRYEGNPISLAYQNPSPTQSLNLSRQFDGRDSQKKIVLCGRIPDPNPGFELIEAAMKAQRARGNSALQF